jgi:hypothetical protein
MNEKIESLYETLAGLAPNIHHAVEGLQREIEAKQAELVELRDAHAQATKILYAVDPSSKPASVTKGPKRRASAQNAQVSDVVVDQVYDWLVAHTNGEPFWGNQILERDDFDVATQTTLSRALNVLPERGQQQLQRTGMGGRKIFKLTSA